MTPSSQGNEGIIVDWEIVCPSILMSYIRPAEDRHRQERPQTGRAVSGEPETAAPWGPLLLQRHLTSPAAVPLDQVMGARTVLIVQGFPRFIVQ